MRGASDSRVAVAAGPIQGARRIAKVFVFIVPSALQVPLLLMLGGACAATCAISLVVGLTWNADNFLPYFIWTGVITGAVALLTGYFALRVHCIECTQSEIIVGSEVPTPVACQRMFLRYQIGVGFSLLLLGIVSVFVFAGLVHRLQFDSASPPLTEKLTAKQIAEIAQTCSLRIILALNMAILGALFFIANSLRKLRICHRPFDSNVFWGGLWYRIGEAVLFTLVFLLIIHWKYKGDLLKTSTEYDLLLPLLALILGMFIKTGERIVFGTAERIFAAATAMLPVQPEVIEPHAKHDSVLLGDISHNRGNGSGAQ
jgi:hypothetical protein